MVLKLADIHYKEKSPDYSHLRNIHPDAELY